MEPEMTSSPRVIVVGGGICGLATAHFLNRSGIDTNVYEQATRIGEIGAGVALNPTSWQLLERSGLKHELAAIGRPEFATYFYRTGGPPISRKDYRDGDTFFGWYGCHRADLVGVLAASLPTGTVHTGHRCTGFEQDSSGAHVFFAGGKEIAADVVIATDGIHSTLQQHVVAPSEPVPSGWIAYRGLVPAERAPQVRADSTHIWMGEGKHFLAFPVRLGAVLNFVGFVPGRETPEESWSAPQETSGLVREFAGWGSDVQAIIAGADSTFFSGLYDRQPLSRWTNERLILLGDAAHPMLPHHGQGANQAIEDAAGIASVLGRVGKRDLPAALEAYAQLRQRRTDRIQTESRRQGDRYDSVGDYEDLEKRDTEVVELEEGFRRWLCDYDVEARAEALEW